MPALNVREKPDMTFNIFMEGYLLHESVEKPDLKRYLSRYHVIDEKYNDLMKELAGNGIATVTIPLGKFEQR
jgi:hypothetical protein